LFHVGHKEFESLLIRDCMSLQQSHGILLYLTDKNILKDNGLHVIKLYSPRYGPLTQRQEVNYILKTINMSEWNAHKCLFYVRASQPSCLAFNLSQICSLAQPSYKRQETQLVH
jgi:hypothetical protein